MNLLDPDLVTKTALARGAPWTQQNGTREQFYVEGVTPDANNIGIPNDNSIDKWNDTCGIIEWQAGKPVLIFATACTTTPGIYYDREHIIGWGGRAAAIIDAGYQACWQVGIHQAGSAGAHEALVQTGGECRVWRDIDQTLTRGQGTIQSGWFGINQHSTADYPVSDNTIGGFSAGCLVIPHMGGPGGHLRRMELIKGDPRTVANPQRNIGSIVMPAEWLDPAGTQVTIQSQPSTGFRSMVPGGYFATPDDTSLPLSIRTNNPGAINGAAWEKSYPGYAGTITGTPGNATTVFETPEAGVAVWWELLRKYRAAGAITVGQIVNRYGGGQDYSSYLQFVAQHAGLSSNTEIKLDDDATLLAFGKAMFWYEAGRQTPLHDDQILYGFGLGRSIAFGGPAPMPNPPAVVTPPVVIIPPPGPAQGGLTPEQIAQIAAVVQQMVTSAASSPKTTVVIGDLLGQLASHFPTLAALTWIIYSVVSALQTHGATPDAAAAAAPAVLGGSAIVGVLMKLNQILRGQST